MKQVFMFVGASQRRAYTSTSWFWSPKLGDNIYCKYFGNTASSGMTRLSQPVRGGVCLTLRKKAQQHVFIQQGCFLAATGLDPEPSSSCFLWMTLCTFHGFHSLMLSSTSLTLISPSHQRNDRKSFFVVLENSFVKIHIKNLLFNFKET